MLKSRRHTSQLTPCPRCREQPMVIIDLSQNGRYHLVCEPCKFYLPDLPTEEQAVALWEFVAMGAVRFYPLTVTNPEIPDARSDG